MIYLSGAVRDELPSCVGVMLSLQMGNKLPETRIWAADNGCFNRPDLYSHDKYLRMLDKFAWARERCLFATAPDVWGDAAATIERSREMFQPLRDAGYKAALVAQDGMLEQAIPWDEIDCLFIGGNDAWRTGDGFVALCRETVERGKWLHMGRVNSLKRIRYAISLGCHSADGTYVKYGPAQNIPKLAKWLDTIYGESPELKPDWC